MNTMQTTEIWALTRARLQQRYPGLTEEDLRCAEGSEAEMLERLELRLGISPMEMAALLEDVLRGDRISDNFLPMQLAAGRAPPC